MGKDHILMIAFFLFFLTPGWSQTLIPNAGFEDWTTGSYSDPLFWDTPNQELMAIPFFGFPVVTKSTDHHGTGNYSARLETKHLTFPPLDIPGFMTCGTLIVDINTGTYQLTGGQPIHDMPTHLKGYYKYLPKGGDSCVIGIGLTRYNGGTRDSIGYGVFSTKDTVSDWTPFSAWIYYDTTVTPDTMNIIALSTAQEAMTIGTVLFMDDLYLDYTVGSDPIDPHAGIEIYHDRETRRLIVFCDLPGPSDIRVSLYNMTGRQVTGLMFNGVSKERLILPYTGNAPGVYILSIWRDNRHFTKKYYLEP